MDRVSYAMRLVGGSIGGKYEIIRVLGIGGMGAVYEARHGYTGRRVAVKVLGPDFAQSRDAVERFLQEAQAPSSIGHPNIVEVLDAGEDPAYGLYVVLEYLDGEDLEAAVERGTMDLPTLLQVTAQLLDALGAAHARGFVHRDIKPANIFLTKNRDGSVRVKLLDFGIAKNVARGLTVGNAVMGTPHYMAPEQAQGHPVDARADLWAVGAVLFHALAGVPPYDGDNPNVIMVNIILGEVPSLRARCPQLSPALHDVVARALTKDRDARWRDAQQMADALAAAPERHGGVLKISSTMRNRGGAVSEMRAAPAARAGTGTLGPEDLVPDAPPVTAAPSPPARTVPVAAPVAAPASRARWAIAAGTAAVAAVVLVAARAVSPTATPPARPAPVIATPPARPVAAPPVAAPPVAAPPVAAPAPVMAAAVAAPVDAAVAPEPEREPRHAHGHHPRHAAPTTAAAAPAAAPAAPAPSTHRIGGLNIGSYNSP